ncbi:S9 family peptidase [Porticoccaceae bacterium]|nr:S9 family peptidase [Porticoccaceae bacterium]
MEVQENHTTTMFARYQRAQTLMQGFLSHTIVPNASVFPIWIKGSECFWYERELNSKKTVGSGEPLAKWNKEYRLVNAKAATNILAFDHKKFAATLAEITGQTVDPYQLPITAVTMQLDAANQVEEIHFTAFDKNWVFEPPSGNLREGSAGLSTEWEFSPDGHYAIFIRDYNLWLHEIASGEERALTRDGEELYCYGATGNGWGLENDGGVQARWSPDSKRVLTLQRDSRQVLTQPMIEHVPQDGSVRPKLSHVKKAIQGDEHIPEYRLLAIDIDSGKIQPANYRQIPVVRNSFGFFTSNLGWWGNDNRRAYFIDLERDYQTVSVVEFDTATGATRRLFEETSKTHISLMHNSSSYPSHVPLPDTQELVWFSERSGWAHLYLYDLETGELKRPLTSGEWLVRETLSVDTVRRELFIQTAGREASGSDPAPDRDPYYRDLARVNLDTGKLATLVSGNYDVSTLSGVHLDMDKFIAQVIAGRDIEDTSNVSPDGNFAVITRSRADTIPVSLLVDRNGEELLELETAELSPLYQGVSEQWQWPEPVKTVAADDTTDIYGLVYRPSDFSPDQSWPVIMHITTNPEAPRVPKGAFHSGLHGKYYMEGAALAELGFVVVQLDGRGTGYRQKAFYDESYGWAQSASTLADQVAGLRQLADRYPYMDLNRVGIFSPAGGTGAVQGLLNYPDVFKVGVNSVMHDARLQTYMWGDKYEGLSNPNPNYRHPEAYADNLQGKLLLMMGMLGVSCPVANTFRLVEALHKANKDFDMLLLPNQAHGTNSYMYRRAWDYLVEHLQGTKPPKEFKLKNAMEGQ